MRDYKTIKRYLKQQVTLTKEEHPEETLAEIVEGSLFKGYNFWILFFAMIIACIGLNTDSTSALIGAMLISPLMGPIVGFAFGVSINNAKLKKQGIANWFIMTLISLLASTLFFYITPFQHNTSAIFSFTKASIFDVLMAFFGGMAGFIGIVKKEGTKVIAGVAVATACMPPLCTAGYGLAHADITYFFGGLYYYLINCLYIGLATFVLSRVLGYHIYFNCKKSLNKTIQFLWMLFIVLMLLPSLYIAYTKYKQEYLNPTSQSTDKQRIDSLEKRLQIIEHNFKLPKN